MSSLAAQRVAVTGAGGFIGSHLCDALVERDADVRALCRYTSRRDEGNLAALSAEVRAGVTVEFGDLRDRDFVGRWIAGADIVLHLAASISVPYSYAAPREVVMTNIEGTLNVLCGAVDADVQRMVQISSSEVYGTAQYAPIDERHPLDAKSPYAASKVGADKLAESFHLAFGLPVVIARPFNTYGPRQSLRAVIPTVVSQALVGTELDLGALTPTRDFVFVRDTVEGIIRLATGEPSLGETYNIATGTDVSIADVVKLVGDLLGKELEARADARRMRPKQSEVYRLQGDPTKLRELTGWAPATPLREGLQAVIDWLRNTDQTLSRSYAI
jgi:NAD dependent epimerase/dehydratase